MKPLALKTFSLACVFAGAGALHAVDLQNLIDRSPFSPPAQAGDTSGAAEPQGTLEFRGVVTDDAGTAYSIFDTTTNKGRWVRADDANSPVQVKNFDAANNTLEIEQNGRPVKLALKRVTIQAGQPVSAMIPPTPIPMPGNPAQPNQNGEARKPDAAADSRRLEAVAAEVRRRRALRNSTKQGQPPAPNAAPATPPAPGP